eukprot:CAMPEP_0181501916 /NCGR_PEP_ID=MMETSP1110-20121109/56061_1 /TAXON_ID=174948 /ORGANISM="Symbiodinium sp., Strain CCMP421" /LENGTH=192 /DNA_ID=CAMNT_0023630429 /DNA_START=438 /DNA_END=1013 /DNA_ORIENTATION=+
MIHKLFVSFVVSHHEAVKSQLLPKYFGQEPAVPSRWHAHEGNESRHDCQRPCFDASNEGGQVNVSESGLRHVALAVVQACLYTTVASKVLQARSQASSAVRPQRWSRDTSTMGAKVHIKPARVASTAVARAVRRASSGSKEAASANGMGKMVHMPCQMSAPKINGMPRRLSSTATRCSSRFTLTPSPLKNAL